MTLVSGWGRFPVVDSELLRPRSFEAVGEAVGTAGAIAADVHGKNHHCEGGFGRYVDSILLRTGQGDTIEASREQNSDAFFATIGGMGLTGVILEATMRLRPVETGWIRER